jgi:hypothetical protein
MDNFDETEEKQLLIEIILNNSYKNLILKQETTTDIENLLQNNDTKLQLQPRNSYSKLAFIKALKENLLCLGFLEETIETLNYASEDLINSTLTSASKKRKVLMRKKSQDKDKHSVFERFEHEVYFLN